MNAIILAAGMGRRLYPLTKNTPKSLIELGDGKTIFETEISALRRVKAIKNIYVVVGYKSEKIEKKIKDCKMEKVYTLYNPFYDTTNNLVSAWVARYQMVENDFILINGDDVFHSSVVASLVKHDLGIYVTIDRNNEYDEDDMKVISKGNRIMSIGKNIKIKKANGRSIGVIKVAGKIRMKYVEVLENLIRNREYLQKFHLEVINGLIKRKYLINYCECSSNEWAEVDYHPDLFDMKQKINQFSWSDKIQGG